MSQNYSIQKPKLANLRQRKCANTRIRGINLLCEEVYQNSNALNASFAEWRNARLRLQHSLREIVSRENRLRQHTDTFQASKNELKEAAQDMKNLYTFEDEKQVTTLNLHTTLALEDTSIAQQQIDHIKKELDHLSPIVEESRHGYGNTLRCYDKVVIPQTDTNCMSKLPAPAFRSDSHTCSVCLEKEAICVIIECGHVCLCQRCAVNLTTQPENNKCPICRGKIKDIIVPVPI